MPEENIYQKIEKQTELLEKIAESTKKTQRYILVGRILSIIKILIIITPIILAVIYLPPFVSKMIDKYQKVIPGLENIEEFIEQYTPGQINQPSN